VKSTIADGSSITTNSGGVSLNAANNTLIMADAGGISGAGAGGKKDSAGAGSLGISLAVNVIANSSRAYVEDSTVTSNGDVTLDAGSDSKIWALTLGGSGAGAGSTEEEGYALSVGGAITVNVVTNTTEAYLGSGSAVTTTSAGKLLLNATDSTLVLGNAIGLSGAGAGGKTGATAASGGVSLAVNVVDNTVNAYIAGATVNAAGNVELNAKAESTIWALAVGGSGAGAGSSDEGSFAFSGGGAVTVNTVTDAVGAYVAKDGDGNAGSITMTNP